jgi:hypothetical protein
MASKANSRGGGILCCVVGCNRNTKRDQGKVKFFSFPTRNQEQRILWIKAVKRVDSDGKTWIPEKWRRICSDHFIGGQWSPTRDNTAYAPSLFPTKHVHEKTTTDVDRFERRRNRESGPSQVAHSHTAPDDPVPMDEDLVEAVPLSSSSEMACQTDLYDNDEDDSCEHFVFACNHLTPGEVEVTARIPVLQARYI